MCINALAKLGVNYRELIIFYEKCPYDMYAIYLADVIGTYIRSVVIV